MTNITEEALRFAVNAHKGQVRKSEKTKPYILHPITVGEILREYGSDENVIAAGYLHDVIEDTIYTYDDIKNRFGLDIANLVKVATETDKSLPWEARKNITINKIRLLSLRDKLVVLADKINNLEDLNKLFSLNGEDYSSFNRGKKYQEWYHKNLYNSIIKNESKDNELFQRYYNAIIKLFGLDKKDDCFECENFEQNDLFCLRDYYEDQLKHLKSCPVKSLKNRKF